jgi:hypothetical protein
MTDGLKWDNTCKHCLGRKQLLIAALEKEIADHVLPLATIFFGTTQTEPGDGHLKEQKKVESKETSVTMEDSQEWTC